MPLGASITQGFDTTQHPDQTTQGGYRQPLREQLRFSGWEVNYIGSKENGLFADNQNEGHPGYVIDQVKSAMDPVLNDEKPNLVLINAGTNDCTLADSQYGGISYVQGVGQRYQQLIDSRLRSTLRKAFEMHTHLVRNLPGEPRCHHYYVYDSTQFWSGPHSQLRKPGQYSAARIVCPVPGARSKNSFLLR